MHLTQYSSSFIYPSHAFTVVTRILPIAVCILDNFLFKWSFSSILHQPVLQNSEPSSCWGAVCLYNIVILCCARRFSISACGRCCYIKYNYSGICLYTRQHYSKSGERFVEEKNLPSSFVSPQQFLLFTLRVDDLLWLLNFHQLVLQRKNCECRAVG